MNNTIYTPDATTDVHADPLLSGAYSGLDEKYRSLASKGRGHMASDHERRDYILTCIGYAVIVMLFAFMLSHKSFQVSGQSMYPTFKDGQYLFTRRFYTKGEITRGTVVTFIEDDGEGGTMYFVKRVIALPGETFQIRDGYCYIDGERYEEDIHKEPMTTAGMLDRPVTLGEDEYICLGDNREDSLDSREIGPVSYSQINAILK